MKLPNSGGPKARHELTPLCQRALAILKADLKATGNNPSFDQWSALVAAIGCLDRLTKGNSANRIFLTAADPGTGKTTALRAFLKALSESPKHRKIGVLICINSYREIEAFVSSLGGLSSKCFVWTYEEITTSTGVERYNRKRSPERFSGRIAGDLVDIPLATSGNDAQFLITTHERVRRVLNRYGSFAKASPLWFDGRPRRVKCWDESFSPVQTVAMNVSDLLHPVSAIANVNPLAYQVINCAVAEMERLDDDQVYVFPDLLQTCGFDSGQVHELIENGRSILNEKQKDIITVLQLISGQAVRVRVLTTKRTLADGTKDNRRALLTYTDSTLADLSPMLVMDASGRLREFYQDLARRGVMQILPSAAKDYGPMRPYIWERASGKDTLRPQGVTINETASEIAKLIASKPISESWLIISHPQNLMQISPVASLQPYVDAELAKLGVPSTAERVKYLTWGLHRATNEFVDISNVILASILTLPKIEYEVQKRAAIDLKPEDGSLNADVITSYRLSEYMNDILQAVCRIRVRRPGAQCLEAGLYVIASRSSGIKKILPIIFPGLGEIGTWGPNTAATKASLSSWRDLKGHKRKTFDALIPMLAQDGTGQGIQFSIVMQRAGISDRSNFSSAVKNTIEFKKALQSFGISEAGSLRMNRWKVTDHRTFEIASSEFFGFSALAPTDT